MLVFLCLCLHFISYSQLCTKCIHRKGVIVAARSCPSKSARARMPCHLSLYHCVCTFIYYMCNCLGTWFSTTWEITSFYKKKKSPLHWLENNNKSWSPWSRGGRYAYLIRMKGVLCMVYGFMFSIAVSSYLYSGLWHPVLKALFMVPLMERDKKN